MEHWEGVCPEPRTSALVWKKILLYHIKHTKDVIVLSAWFVFWDSESRVKAVVYRK